MFLKLVFRGLKRYKKTGRHFFILVGLCSAAMVFLLSFSFDAYNGVIEQSIGMVTGHLQIVHGDSPLAKDSFGNIGGAGRAIKFLELDDDWDNWLNGIPDIVTASPAISTHCKSHNLDGELETDLSLLAVPASKLASLLPEAKIIEGSAELYWPGPGHDIPVIRRERIGWEIRNLEMQNNYESFEFYSSFPELEEFIKILRKDFPQYFMNSLISDKEELAASMTMAINDRLLVDSLPAFFLEEYKWEIDDAISELRENLNPERIPFLNKRLFQVLYPNYLRSVQEAAVAGKRVSLMLHPFSMEDESGLFTIIPAVYTGFTIYNQLFGSYSFIDINAFRYMMELDTNATTSWIIRLEDKRDTQTVKALIEKHIENCGINAAVLDYKTLGKEQMGLAQGIRIILLIPLIILFAINLIFTLNLVLSSIIQRKREIGTALAMGQENRDTIIIMASETGLIAVLSALAGASLGYLIVWLAGIFGIPGMFFLVGEKLYLSLRLAPLFQSCLFLILPSLITAIIFLSGLRKKYPVELLGDNR